MELNEAFKLINKNLEQSAAELGFEAAKTDDGSIIYHGEKGAFKVSHNKNNDGFILTFPTIGRARTPSLKPFPNSF
jgi:hypothetical protein